MNIARFDPPQASSGPHEPGLPAAAIQLLLEAYEGACERGREAWVFAVEIRCLREAGLTHTQLRQLLSDGHLEQGVEESRAGERRRQFRRVTNLSLAEDACFVLTASGAAYMRARREGHTLPVVAAPGRQRPVWDPTRRELRVGGVIVKRFRQPAASQELVLAVFEEEGWPPRIFDPLPPLDGQDAKRRLHSTICNLNRGHEERRLRFEGGGDAVSIGWRLVVAAEGSEYRASTGRV